jgi:shikimate kinase
MVFLVGFMGAGKTSVGLVLSRHLGWEFQDVDDLIESRTGQTIDQIFRERGEANFRAAEREAVRAVLNGAESRSCVLALGGGAFAETETASLLTESGYPIIFLDAPVEELWRRCSQHGTDRPLHRDFGQFSALYQSRHACYLRAALRVETEGKAIETIAVEVAERLGLR